MEPLLSLAAIVIIRQLYSVDVLAFLGYNPDSACSGACARTVGYLVHRDNRMTWSSSNFFRTRQSPTLYNNLHSFKVHWRTSTGTIERLCVSLWILLEWMVHFLGISSGFVQTWLLIWAKRLMFHPPHFLRIQDTPFSPISCSVLIAIRRT